MRVINPGMLETYAHADALADAAADAIAAALADAVAGRGYASLVATGGRSPEPIYDRLALRALDWGRVTVTLSDERCVAPDAPESNARLLRERLLKGPAAAARFIPLWPEPPPEDFIRPFDVVMLGMGEDGHIASLIPGDPGLSAAYDTAELTRPVPAGLGSPPVARITLTLPPLAEARAIFLLIAGEAKRHVLARAEAGEDLPVGRLLRAATGQVRILWAPAHSLSGERAII